MSRARDDIFLWATSEAATTPATATALLNAYRLDVLDPETPHPVRRTGEVVALTVPAQYAIERALYGERDTAALPIDAEATQKLASELYQAAWNEAVAWVHANVTNLDNISMAYILRLEKEHIDGEARSAEADGAGSAPDAGAEPGAGGGVRPDVPGAEGERAAAAPDEAGAGD